jgi:hypothetical protein
MKQTTTALQNNKDIILVPRSWWKERSILWNLIQEMGWWYTLSSAIIFQESNACKRRKGDDLDKGTKTTSTWELEKTIKTI